MLATGRIAEIADYCRVDADDAQLPALIAAAEGYLLTGVCSEPAPGSPRAEVWLQCVKYLTLDMLDRRDMTIDGSVTDNPAFQRLKTQLKLTNPTALSDFEGAM